LKPPLVPSACPVARQRLSRRFAHTVTTAAAEIARLNLILHGQAKLGDEVLAWAKQGSRPNSTAQKIKRLEKQTRQKMFSNGREVQIAGLSGLQYREFFTMLLPLYEQFGVPGAPEQLSAIHDDEPKRKALDELSAIYQDEDLMSTIPIEL
jgi:hypothetical protein